MREMEDSAVTDTAMPDIRIEDKNQHQHLAVAIPPVEASSGVMDAGSPSLSAEYQTVMPSPTIPAFPSSRSRSDGQPFGDTGSIIPSAKRTSAYFTDTADDNLCKDSKRRRLEPHDPAEPSNPQASPTAVRAAESIRRSGSRPRNFRCRSHSLPDQTTISRIVQGEAALKPTGTQLQNLQTSSNPVLLPCLSSEGSVNSDQPFKRRIRDQAYPPPITKVSLRELETPEILKNAQLIHDIIHDPTLQFRPNLEGPRGERKRLMAEEYWSALEREVDRLKVCLVKDPSGLVKLSSNRFPVLFVELRDILCSLLPIGDRLIVKEVIDPEFLCQELFRGVLNVGNLATFLARTMKEHCAPMRDSQIEKMVKQFEIAQESGGTPAFVLGLRMVFEILEGMKLDVANHQLRTMKKELQDRAVSNEREYFEERIAKGKMSLAPIVSWIKPYIENEPSSQHFAAFSKAFLSLLSPLALHDIPATFFFDIPRVTNFRKDFRDLISVQLCLLLYRELSLSLHPKRLPPLVASFNALRLEIWAIIADLPDISKYAVSAPSLAVQIALRATQHCNPNATVPAAHLVSAAKRWIDIHVDDTANKVFYIAEKRVQDYFINHFVAAQVTCIPQTPLRGCENEGTNVWATGTETAMWLLAERMHRVAAFHWVVFGDVYAKESGLASV